MGLRTFPGKFLVRVWSFVAIRAEMLKQRDQNLSEPVHNTVIMYALCAMPFLHFWMLLFFSITSYPAEIAYFNSPYWEFPTVYGLWNCIEIEMYIPLGAHA